MHHKLSVISDHSPTQEAQRGNAQQFHVASQCECCSRTPPLTMDQRDKIKSALFGGKIDVLFISPETLTSASFARITRQTGFPTVGFVCIDEVHCVSHWSHNFRPAYLRLAMVVSQLFGSETCLLGLTATATPQTEVGLVCFDYTNWRRFPSLSSLAFLRTVLFEDHQCQRICCCLCLSMRTEGMSSLACYR